MFLLSAEKNKLTVLQREMVTSGSANVYHARFYFSDDWAGLAKTVYFRSGAQTVPMLLGDSGECVIPWEVTDPDDAGKTLYVGICGSRDGKIVLPTVEANLGTIMPGVSAGMAQMPTPSVYEQLLTALGGKQDALHGVPGQVVGFDEAGNAVSVDMPSAGEPGSAGPAGEEAYQFGHGLKKDGNTVSVDLASDGNPDKTLPISAAAVDSVVGDIDTILQIIRGV